jgi:cell division inhibitor SepF
MSFLKGIQNYLLGSEYDDEDEDEAVEEDQEELRPREPKARRERPEPVPLPKRGAGFESKVVNLPPAVSMHGITELMVFRPEVVEDAAEVCSCLKNGNAICAVCMEGTESANAQRIADFLAGACYALGGEIGRLSTDIFAIAPQGVPISKMFKDDLKAKDSPLLPWITSAFKNKP